MKIQLDIDDKFISFLKEYFGVSDPTPNIHNVVTEWLNTTINAELKRTITVPEMVDAISTKKAEIQAKEAKIAETPPVNVIIN